MWKMSENIVSCEKKGGNNVSFVGGKREQWFILWKVNENNGSSCGK